MFYADHHPDRMDCNVFLNTMKQTFEDGLYPYLLMDSSICTHRGKTQTLNFGIKKNYLSCVCRANRYISRYIKMKFSAFEFKKLAFGFLIQPLIGLHNERHITDMAGCFSFVLFVTVSNLLKSM